MVQEAHKTDTKQHNKIYINILIKTVMGCKLSVSVIHPESIVNKIKESMSPTSKKMKTKKKITPEEINIDESDAPEETPDSPDSIDIYKTIYLDSP